MTLDLNAQIAARTAAAIQEALDQLNNGWTPDEVRNVMADAWDVIADLKDQAAAQEDLDVEILGHLMPMLWDSACGQASPMHHNLRCFLEQGHTTGHLYTVRTQRRAA